MVQIRLKLTHVDLVSALTLFNFKTRPFAKPSAVEQGREEQGRAQQNGIERSASYRESPILVQFIKLQPIDRNMFGVIACKNFRQ